MRAVRAKAGAAATLAVLVLAAGPAWGATNSTTLSNGALLSVTVAPPAGTAGTFLIPSGSTNVDVPLTGSASIGTGAPNVHWTYVIDVSGSTGSGCGSAGGTVLDCEKQAVANLNSVVAAGGSALDVGLAVFGENAASADMSGDAGEQLVTSPGSPGVGTVINSVAIGGIGAFTPHSVGSNFTNFSAGLAAATASVNASVAASKNVVFLSDGFSNTGSGFAAALAGLAGTRVYSFAVGSGASCTGGSNGTLAAMAAATGGTCTNVPDPANLPGIVQNVTATQMTSVSLKVDTAVNPLATISPAPPFAGPASTAFTATAADQGPGQHTACATAAGKGPLSASEQSTEACETYNVFGFALTPATATNELGTDQQHTITATVTGEPGHLEGWPVAFAVTGQNAGATGTCAPASCESDADGRVTFTYNVPVASASLGTDTIEATVTVDDETGSRQVGKVWRDTTPPVVQCVAGPNPGGQIPAAPGKGMQGQNQDGFYTISATDDVSAAGELNLYVKDNGSGTVFGGYANPTNIKYVQAKGAEPTVKAGSGAVAYNITGKGDAVVYAVDGSGNTSAAVSCLVPPRPQ